MTNFQTSTENDTCYAIEGGEWYGLDSFYCQAEIENEKDYEMLVAWDIADAIGAVKEYLKENLYAFKAEELTKPKTVLLGYTGHQIKMIQKSIETLVSEFGEDSNTAIGLLIGGNAGIDAFIEHTIDEYGYMGYIDVCEEGYCYSWEEMPKQLQDAVAGYYEDLNEEDLKKVVAYLKA